MDKSEDRTPTRAAGRSEAASPTTTSAAPVSAYFSPLTPRPRTIVPSAPHFSASRSHLTPCPRTTVPSAPHFSASRSRMRPALPRLPPVVDYSKHDVKMMKDLRLVPEEQWFPHHRDKERLTGSWFWTVVQKDLYLPDKKKVSDMRSIDWASVGTSTGTDVRRYFAATPGLDRLLERQDLRWADSYIRQFYATLWIHPDRSKIKFMFGKQQRELSRDDFAKYLGLSDSGAQVHSLVNSNGNGDKDHPPPLETIRHLYNNPDTLMEVSKDLKQLNHETAVVLAIVRLSIRPRPRGLDKLTTLEIWILHLLMSEKPIDIVDLMIGEMQAVIVDIRRLLAYAPYLIHLFDKKGWLEVAMKNDLDQHLMQYKPPKPGNKRRVKNKTLQTVKSNKAPKPDGRSGVGTSSLSSQVEAPRVLDDDEDARLDRTLSPSLEEQALVVTANEEDDNPYMVLAPVPGEFIFNQQGAHDAEAGGSGCHADVPPMLQSQADRQTLILEKIQGQLTELQRQHERDVQKIQGQAHGTEAGGSGCHTDVPPMLQSHADRQTAILEQIQRQLAELHRQHEFDLQKIQGQAHDTEAGGSGCHADLPPMLQSQADRQTAILEQIQGQLAELQRQHERDLEIRRQHERDLQEIERRRERDLQKIQGQLAEHRQENRDLRNLVLLSFFQTACHSTQHSDIVALLNENLGAICRL